MNAFRGRSAQRGMRGPSRPPRRPARRRSARVRRNRRIAAALLASVLLLVAVALIRALPEERPDGRSARSAAVSDSRLRPAVAPVDPPWEAPSLDGDGIKVGTYLGSPQRRFYGAGGVPDRLDVLWKLEVGAGYTQRKSDGKKVLWSGTGWTGQPLLVREGSRDYLIFGGFDHELRKVDALTGKHVWSHEFDDVIKGTPSILPGPGGGLEGALVVAGSRRGAEYSLKDERIAPVRAVTLAEGREVWRFPLPRTASYSRDADASALLWRGSLLQAAENGIVYRLDPFETTPWNEFARPKVLGTSAELFTKSEARSRKDVGGANVVVEGSPALVGDVAYVPTGAGHVVGLSLPDLEQVWDFDAGSDIDSSVTVDSGGRLLVGIEQQYVSGAGGALMLDPSKPAEDAVVWYYPATTDSGIAEWEGGVVGSVAVSDEYDTAGEPRLAAFAAVDGWVYVVAADELAEGTVRGPNGERGWPTPRLVDRFRTGGSISTPLLVDDRLVIGGYDGVLRVYSIDRRRASASDRPDEVFKGRDGGDWRVRIRERASFAGGAAFESTPLVWKGRLYVGCRDGWFYCLGEK